VRTPPVSRNHRGLASIGSQNVLGHTMVCLERPDTYCESSHLYCNCELIEPARAMVLGAMMNAKPMAARGAHNQATG
jgi:hypothetical protein